MSRCSVLRTLWHNRAGAAVVLAGLDWRKLARVLGRMSAGVAGAAVGGTGALPPQPDGGRPVLLPDTSSSTPSSMTSMSAVK